MFRDGLDRCAETVWTGWTMPLNMQSLKLCRCSVPPQDFHPMTLPSAPKSTSPTLNIQMKYLEACQLKALIDRSITSLERSIAEGTITAARRKWLVSAHMSHHVIH